ncbi:FIST N-terminal domain-containing protein [Roseibium sp. AS2]|uniref:FIST N-terminal domain-containing protein n=1 Tax=Roseibium sp. AS2 TaxID=3135781 RepID=UPI00316AFAB9
MSPADTLCDKPTTVEIGVSHARGEEEAVREATAGFKPGGTCFVLFFMPDHLDPEKVAAQLSGRMPSAAVFGCSTAGQITSVGYENDALLVIAFPRRHFRCSSTLIKPLKPGSIERTANQAQVLAERFSRTGNWKTVAFVIADGMSKQEDLLVAALNAGLRDIPVFGGSAGNGLAFNETYVLHGGVAHQNAALLLLIETDLSFGGVGFDHFRPTDRQMVVTGAVPEERLVMEINGVPAAREYARYVNCAVEDLSPRVFAENPVLVRSGKSWHVRAIQQVADNDGLWFLSAIDDGLVLTLGQGTEILNTLEQGLEQCRGEHGDPDFIIGFDCYLRRLEIEQNELVEDASRVLTRNRVFGFNTYGEQHLGVHVNQTFVGVAFYPPEDGVLY